MKPGTVLEIASICERHPRCGTALLHYFGPPLMYRLAVDPTAALVGSKQRKVEVEYLDSGAIEPATSVVAIGWAGLPDSFSDICSRTGLVLGIDRITEHAAIGAMSLFVSEFGGAKVVEVIQNGSGPDYMLTLQHRERKIPVEVSGIRQESSPREARSRVRQKSRQALKWDDRAIVSVTVFHSATGGEVSSYLHFVERPAARRKKSSRRRR